MKDYLKASEAVSAGKDKSNKNRLIKLFAIAAFLYWMGLYLYAPTLPLYAASKSSNLQLIGLALSMYGLGHVIIRFPAGIFSGWLGRNRPLIIIGLSLVGLGALIMALAVDIRGFAVGRAITGIAAGTWVPLVLAFCSLFPLEEGIRATAVITFVGTFARLVASSVTGLLNDLGGYRLAFFLALGVSILAILIVFSAQEAQLQPQKPSFKNISRVVIRQDVLLPSTLGTLALHAEWAVTFGFLPILAKQIGVSDVGQSVLLSTYLIAYMLGNFVAISLSSRPKDRLLYICFAVISIGMASVMIAQSMPMLLTVQALIGIAQGVCYPTLMGLSITNVASADRSTAMGIYQTLYAVGMFTGPWLSGLLAAAIGIRPMFGVTACALISLSLILIHRLLSLKSDMQNELVELNY